MNKSVYAYAAEAGLPLGLYLTAMSACLLLSLRVPSLPLLMVPLAVAFPFILLKMMRRVAVAEPAYNRFVPLWLFGIYAVIFATLVCAIISGVWLTFFEQGFMTRYIQKALDDAAALPDASAFASSQALMREALDKHLVPTGLEFVAAMSWLTAFSGSILSLILAALLSLFSGR